MTQQDTGTPDTDTPDTDSSDGRRPLRRALVSVYDKTGLGELAHALAAAGVEIVSTGSTATRSERRGERTAPLIRPSPPPRGA